MEYCTNELLNIASNGNVVLTERIDRVHTADGSVAIEIPIMGSFIVDDGKTPAMPTTTPTLPSRNGSRCAGTNNGAREGGAVSDSDLERRIRRLDLEVDFAETTSNRLSRIQRDVLPKRAGTANT
jgi:hypothetical protein